MFCRLRQCRQILPKLNLSAILLLFLIKRAALGNLKVNFHCAHFAQPFSSGYRGCTNRPFNSLYDPFGSPCRGQKRCSNRFAIRLADHQRSTPAAKLQFFMRG